MHVALDKKFVGPAAMARCHYGLDISDYCFGRIHSLVLLYFYYSRHGRCSRRNRWLIRLLWLPFSVLSLIYREIPSRLRIHTQNFDFPLQYWAVAQDFLGYVAPLPAVDGASDAAAVGSQLLSMHIYFLSGNSAGQTRILASASSYTSCSVSRWAVVWRGGTAGAVMLTSPLLPLDQVVVLAVIVLVELLGHWCRVGLREMAWFYEKWRLR